jgi:hypothetical protein
MNMTTSRRLALAAFVIVVIGVCTGVGLRGQTGALNGE